jgi:hypothetical protein
MVEDAITIPIAIVRGKDFLDVEKLRLEAHA